MQHQIDTVSKDKDKVIIDMRSKLKMLTTVNPKKEQPENDVKFLQETFLLDSYGSHDVQMSSLSKDARIQELQKKFLEVYNELEKANSEL